MPAQWSDVYKRLMDSATLKAANGFTPAELGELYHESIDSLVAAAEISLDETGPAKKQFVLKAIGDLFDIVAPALPSPLWLVPIRMVIRPLARQVVLTLADGAIEYALKKLRSAVKPGGAA